MSTLVTGGAGFIGSNFVHSWCAQGKGLVVNFDKLTYAGNVTNLDGLCGHPDHVFICGDILDADLLEQVLHRYRVQTVVHCAAETHVDRSVSDPETFIQTNVVGSMRLLEVCYRYWICLSEERHKGFRFLHVSTDEVYGSLGFGEESLFTEHSPLLPNNPYAASKAAAEHLVRSYVQTHGFPAVISRCSNNYGPRQFPEKLLPLCLTRAMSGQRIPVYGHGQCVRDWLHVDDHCHALQLILDQGVVGEAYNISAHNEKSNIEMVRTICVLLDEMKPRMGRLSYTDLISFVADRPGHDQRYAMDTNKILSKLKWRASIGFEVGLRETITWYLQHRFSLNYV